MNVLREARRPARLRRRSWWRTILGALISRSHPTQRGGVTGKRKATGAAATGTAYLSHRPAGGDKKETA